MSLQVPLNVLTRICLFQQIYVWRGSLCNFFERNKATELAISIRDNEMSGRGELEIVEEGAEPAKFIEVSYFVFCFF